MSDNVQPNRDANPGSAPNIAQVVSIGDKPVVAYIDPNVRFHELTAQLSAGNLSVASATKIIDELKVITEELAANPFATGIRRPAQAPVVLRSSQPVAAPESPLPRGQANQAPDRRVVAPDFFEAEIARIGSVGAFFDGFQPMTPLEKEIKAIRDERDTKIKALKDSNALEGNALNAAIDNLNKTYKLKEDSARQKAARDDANKRREARKYDRMVNEAEHINTIYDETRLGIDAATSKFLASLPSDASLEKSTRHPGTENSGDAKKTGLFGRLKNWIRTYSGTDYKQKAKGEFGKVVTREDARFDDSLPTTIGPDLLNKTYDKKGHYLTSAHIDEAKLTELFVNLIPAPKAPPEIIIPELDINNPLSALEVIRARNAIEAAAIKAEADKKQLEKEIKNSCAILIEAAQKAVDEAVVERNKAVKEAFRKEPEAIKAAGALGRAEAWRAARIALVPVKMLFSFRPKQAQPVQGPRVEPRA